MNKNIIVVSISNKRKCLFHFKIIIIQNKWNMFVLNHVNVNKFLLEIVMRMCLILSTCLYMNRRFFEKHKRNFLLKTYKLWNLKIQLLSRILMDMLRELYTFFSKSVVILKYCLCKMLTKDTNDISVSELLYFIFKVQYKLFKFICFVYLFLIVITIQTT